MKADIIWDDDMETTVVVLLEPIEVGGWTAPEGTISDGGSIPACSGHGAVRLTDATCTSKSCMTGFSRWALTVR